jgi:hypothetical protein
MRNAKDEDETARPMRAVCLCLTLGRAPASAQIALTVSGVVTTRADGASPCPEPS